MTEKLYFEDSYLFEFESTVREVRKVDDSYEVILESSAFYPESGGQAYDLGLLDNQKVVAVYENDNSQVVHKLENWTAPEGSPVRGVIDKQRRLDNMRKHSGQHILSQAFVRVAGIFTISAHLGERESTIELDAGAIDDDTLRQVEGLTNEIIRENLPVTTQFYSRDELKNLPVRKIPEGKDKYRIVRMGEFECTACAGTHVRNTGEIGLVKIISHEKIRNHVRIIFLCGSGAIEDYYQKNKVIDQLSSKLTCHFMDFNEAVDKLQEYNSELKKEISSLNRKLLPYETENLKIKAVDLNGINLVIETFSNRESKDIIELGNNLCRSFEAVALLAAENRIFVFVSDDIGIDASRIVRLFTDRYEGSGGGGTTFAQIGGISTEKMTYSLESLAGIVKNEIKR